MDSYRGCAPPSHSRSSSSKSCASTAVALRIASFSIARNSPVPRRSQTGAVLPTCRSCLNLRCATPATHSLFRLACASEGRLADKSDNTCYADCKSELQRIDFENSADRMPQDGKSSRESRIAHVTPCAAVASVLWIAAKFAAMRMTSTAGRINRPERQLRQSHCDCWPCSGTW